MKRRWLQLSGIAIIEIILFIGVFFMMKKWNTPNTPAFQDEFTKQFLNAKAETPKGFHLFESWTFKYTILYPGDYVMVDGNYYRKKGETSDVPNVENLYLIQKGFSPKENGMIMGIQLFLVPDGTVVLDSRLRGLLRKVNAPEDTKIEEYKDDVTVKTRLIASKRMYHQSALFLISGCQEVYCVLSVCYQWVNFKKVRIYSVKDFDK